MNEMYLAELEERAMDGDYDAAAELAQLFRTGSDGIEPDPDRAESWERYVQIHRQEEVEPSVQESEEDQEEISAPVQKHMDWLSPEELQRSSLAMLRKQADQVKNPFALSILGNRYLRSQNAEEEDHGKALLEEASSIAEKELSSGEEGLLELLVSNYLSLGHHYESRAARTREAGLFTSAFNYYSSAHELDPNACEDLIRCYEKGIGCKRDSSIAFRLSEKLAEKGGVLEKLEYAEKCYARKQSIRASDWYRMALESDTNAEYPAVDHLCRLRLAEFGETDTDGLPYQREKELNGLIDLAMAHDAFAAYQCAMLIPEQKEYYLSLGAEGEPSEYTTRCQEEIEWFRAEREKEELRKAQEEEARIMRERQEEELERQKRLEEEKAEAAREENKSKRLRLIKRGGVALVALIVIIAVISKVNSPANRAFRAYDNGQYTTASDIYQTQVSRNSVQEEKLSTKVDKELASLLEMHEKGTLDDDTFLTDLEHLSLIASEEQYKTIESYRQAIDSYVSAEGRVANGNYAEAMEDLAKIKEGMPYYEQSKPLKAEAQEGYVEVVLKETDIKPTVTDMNAYSDSFEMLTTAISVLPESTELQNRIEKLTNQFVQKVMKDTSSLEQDMVSYQSAFEMLEQAAEMLPENKDIQNQLTNLTDKFVAMIKKENSGLTKEFKYDEALALVEDAKKVLPGNQDIQAMYLSLKPTALSDMKIVVNNNLSSVEDSCTDSYGNSYGPNNCFICRESLGGGFETAFSLSKEYKYLTGTISVGEGADNGSQHIITIKDDNGNVLYESPIMDRLTKAVSISVDVSNLDLIVISGQYAGSGTWFPEGEIILSDFQLYK